MAADGSTADRTDEAAAHELLERFARGPNEELRVLRATYKGHPYLLLQSWILKRNHRRPSMVKQFSIKMRELESLAGLFQRVAAAERQPALAPITTHRE